MNSEKSLVKSKYGIFSRIRQSIKKFFFKLKNNETNIVEEESEINTQLDDFEILKNVVNGKIEIKDLDIEEEKRLIRLCNNRLDEMNKKITQKNLKIAKMEKLLNDLKEYKVN